MMERFDDLLNEAKKELRMYFKGLEKGRRERLLKILDDAEATGNHYTVMYTLYGVACNLMNMYERLSRAAYRQALKELEENNETGGEDKTDVGQGVVREMQEGVSEGDGGVKD